MTTHHELLKDRFRDKPECVVDFPAGVLSKKMIDAYQRIPGLAIVEIAGRDSVAAAIQAVNVEGFTDLLPVYAYTGTEYGAWASVETAVHRLRKRLAHTRVHDLIVLGSPRFWHAMNGRFTSELIRRYGFYTPCVGCHLYLHAVRMPLSVLLKSPVIAGERERHDGAVKINQTKTALNAYLELADRFKVSLRFPLRQIDDGREIEAILGFDWKQDEAQLDCVFSGNYRLFDKGIAMNEDRVGVYLKEFALPFSQNVLQGYLKNSVPKHQRLALDIIQGFEPKKQIFFSK